MSDDNIIIQSVEWFTCTIPLKRAIELPGGRLEARNPLFVRITSRDGVEGWGEASPLPGFHGWMPQDKLLEQARRAGATVTGEVYDRGLVEPMAPSIAFAISSAVAWIERGASRDRQPSMLSLASLIRNARTETASRAKTEWPAVVKLKVGGDVRLDVAGFNTILAESERSMKVRLDANRNWSYEEASEFVSQIDTSYVDYFEEPFSNWNRFPEFSELSRIDVAVDESLHEASSSDVADVLAKANVAVIKPTMMGSLERCSAVASMAIAEGCRVALSSAYETGIGMSGILDLAVRLGEDQEPAGLGTYGALANDVLSTRMDLTGASVDPVQLLMQLVVQEDRLTPVR